MIKVYTEKYLENPYPEPIDNGTWEDDGGFAARPNYQMWLMETPRLKWPGSQYVQMGEPEIIYIMHPLTYSEYEYVLNGGKY